MKNKNIFLLFFLCLFLIGASPQGYLRVGSNTNYTDFDENGTLQFAGDGTVWDDIRVPASTASRLGNSDPDYEVFKNGVYAYAFADNVDQELMFSVQVPHNWKLQTNLNPHVHWSPPTTGTGTVTWKIEYTIADINGTFGSTNTLTCKDAGDGTAYKHQIIDCGDINMSAYADSGDVSIMLICRIYRDVDDADDFVGDAFLLETDFHYEIDTIGSRNELSK
jgi:hypothetical protein